MSVLTGSSPDELHERRRAALSREILEVVEPLLERGESYGDVSVERIIKAVGMSRSTFYVYFEDKGDLLQAMARDVTADLAAAGRTWFEFAHDGSRDDLRLALTPLFETYRRHRTILGAITEMAASDTGIRERHTALVEAAVARLAAHISAGQAASSTVPGLDPVHTARWLVCMFERGLYLLVAPAGTEEVDVLLHTATDVAWRVLYAGLRD